MPYVTYNQDKSVAGLYANPQPGAKLLPDNDPAVIAHNTRAAWSEIRSLRNLRLAACDYTQLADFAGNKAAWADYRQLLREIPQDYESPDSVVWPEPPES